MVANGRHDMFDVVVSDKDTREQEEVDVIFVEEITVDSGAVFGQQESYIESASTCERIPMSPRKDAFSV